MHRDDPDDHEDRAQGISDERAAVDGAALGGEDVQDRLADQESPAHDRERRGASQHSDHEDSGGDEDFDELQQCVGGQLRARLTERLGEVGDDVLGGLRRT